MCGSIRIRWLAVLTLVGACGGRSEDAAHNTTGVPRAGGGATLVGGATTRNTTDVNGGAGGSTSTPAGGASEAAAGAPNTPATGGGTGRASSYAGGPAIAGRNAQSGAAGEASVPDEPCPEPETDLDYRACKKPGQVCQYSRIESGVDCQIRYRCDQMWSKAYLCHSPEPCPLIEPALDSGCSLEGLRCYYLDLVLAWDDPPYPSPLLACHYPYWCNGGRWQLDTYPCGD